MIEETYRIQYDPEKVQKIRRYLEDIDKNPQNNISQIGEWHLSLCAKRIAYHIEDSTAVIQLGGEPNPDYWYRGHFTFTATTQNKVRRAVSLLERKSDVKIKSK